MRTVNKIFSSNSAKRALIVIFVPILIVGLFMALALVIGLSTSASTTDNMAGYAWSSNIGWTSFNCTNTGTCLTSNYGVTIDLSATDEHNISRYAWSSNVGWLDFNAAGPYPSGVGTSPVSARINTATGQLSGWARFLSNGDGWDGWVSLSGTGYGVSRSGCNLSGFAWGGDVVGWMSFGGASYGVTITDPAFCEQIPAANLFVNGQSGSMPLSRWVFTTAEEINLRWDNLNVSVCDISGSYSASDIQDPEVINGIRYLGQLAQGSYDYTITCYKNIDRTGGSAADTEYVWIDPAPISNISCSVSPSPVFTGQTVNWRVSVADGVAPYTFDLKWYWASGNSCSTKQLPAFETSTNPGIGTTTYTTARSYPDPSYVCMEATVTDSIPSSVSCEGSAGAVARIFKIPDWIEVPPGE